MDEKFIPADVAQFVLDKIDSVAELEALLLLRNHAEREWTPAEISKRLYLGDKQAVEVLAALSTNGLAQYNANGYAYRPASPDTQLMVDRVCEIYSKQIVPMTNLIHSKSRKRVQEFADAFKLRKKDE